MHTDCVYANDCYTFQTKVPAPRKMSCPGFEGVISAMKKP